MRWTQKPRTQVYLEHFWFQFKSEEKKNNSKKK